MFDVLGGDGASPIRGGGGQRVVGGAVDAPRQSACAVGQRLDGGGFEQAQFAAGEAQAVGEVGVEFLAVEYAEVVAHDEALGERFVAGHGEAAAQLGESDEQSIVCYQYQGRAGGCGELEQQVRHLLAGVVVQVARGLVRQ